MLKNGKNKFFGKGFFFAYKNNWPFFEDFFGDGDYDSGG
jgi:hypothetical protein